MAGCVPCFVIPLLLFLFHKFIQPILLKFWNPWENKQIKDGDKKAECKFSCDCAWMKKNKSDTASEIEESVKTNPPIDDKVKGV